MAKPIKIILVGKARTGAGRGVSTELWDQFAFQRNGCICQMVNIEGKGHRKKRPKEIILEILKTKKADLIMYYSTRGVTDEIIRKTTRQGEQSALITMDYLRWHGKSRIRGFIHQARMVNFAFHTGGAPECKKAIQVMQGCEPLQGLRKPARRTFGGPFFVGHTNKDRSDWEKTCKELRITIRGHKKTNKVYRQDLFNLCHNTIAMVGHQRMSPAHRPKDIPGYCSNRLFVVAGYAGCQVHQWFVGIENYFVPDEEILVWRSTEELRETLRRLTKDHDLVTRIAEAGYKRAREEHTYENRARKILKAVGLKN